jgi:hypothetical protein
VLVVSGRTKAVVVDSRLSGVEVETLGPRPQHEFGLLYVSYISTLDLLLKILPEVDC